MAAPMVLADRVKDTTTTTSTGDLTLSGTAPTGYQDFNSAIGVGPSFYYCISASGSAEWEVGIGYLSASTTLVRSVILSSSNSGAVVNLSSGTKDVFVTAPALVFNQEYLGGAAMQIIRGNFLP